MPTLYPGGLDAPANPTQTTSMAGSGFEHDLQHININDAMRAIQQYVGTTGSLVPTSITYVSNNNTANITVLQGNVSTINNQLTITNANVASNTSSIAGNTTSIANLTATKLNLAGGTMTGQLNVQYAPPGISATSYLTSHIAIANTGVSDNPPQLSFSANSLLGMTLYLTGSGLNAISSNGLSSLIINSSGQLNPGSIPNGTFPGAKIVSGSVTTTQLGTGAVNYNNVAANAIDTSKFTSDTIPTIGVAVGVPVGTIILYGGINTPTNYFPCIGWAISRTTYAALFAVISTAYGAGNGSTTFNIPDFRGRVPVGCYYDGANWLAGPGLTARYWGQTGGEENHTLSVAEMPSHAHSISDPTHVHGVGDPGHAHGVSDPTHGHGVSDPGHAHNTGTYSGMTAGPSGFYDARNAANLNTGVSATHIGIYGAGTGIGIYGAGTGVYLGYAGTGIGIYANGGSGAHNNMQPWLGVQYYIKYQ